jgi:RHS repeat-associated protein
MTYALDPKGQMDYFHANALLADGSEGAADTPSRRDWLYDPAGNRSAEAREGGASQSWQANALNQVTVAGIFGSSFDYDLDGNLTGDGVWWYYYDAENRLTKMRRTDYSQSLRFTYDYAGRRVRKEVFTNGDWSGTPQSDLKFLWSGHNLVLEVEGANPATIIRSHVWGLDQSGSLQGAGGVGGLLMTVLPGGAGSQLRLPLYDANGNVRGHLDGNGVLAENYAYTAHGESIPGRGSGSLPFRFASKYWDAETGLYQYNARSYSPSLGRFISRDPIEEDGGLNLYAYCGNNPASRWDYLGLKGGAEYLQYDGGDGSTFDREGPTKHMQKLLDERRGGTAWDLQSQWEENSILDKVMEKGRAQRQLKEFIKRALEQGFTINIISGEGQLLGTLQAVGDSWGPNSISGDLPGANTSAGTASGRVPGLYIERGGFTTDEAYNQAVTDLAKLKVSTLLDGDPTEISKIITGLENNGKYRVVIWPGAYTNQFEGNGSGAYDGTGTGGTVQYNPAGRVQYYGLTPAGASMGYDSLAHELTHAYEAACGVMPRGFPQREYEPIRVQNQLRAMVLGMMLRTTHGTADIDNPKKYITWP